MQMAQEAYLQQWIFFSWYNDDDEINQQGKLSILSYDKIDKFNIGTYAEDKIWLIVPNN